jgi:hypothetical protein
MSSLRKAARSNMCGLAEEVGILSAGSESPQEKM